MTPSEVMDNQPMLDLLWRVRFRWKLRPRHVTGDTKYGAIQNIKALEGAGIRAYVPLPDWEHMTSFFGPSKFTYDAAHDLYVCAQGQPLRRFRTEPMPPPAMLVPSKRSVPKVSRGDNCTAPSLLTTWHECRATTRLRPIIRPCASGKSASNPYSLRPKTGMV